MKKKPFLSIIMPVYNAERYLNESISCILEQKFQDFELIIVNDKSTDYSGRICDSYAQKDDRISVIHLEKNGGAGNARNIGIQKASADYLTFIDADDVIEEDLYFNAFTKAIQYSADIVVWGLTEEYYSNKGEVVFKNYVSMPEQICQNRQQVRDAVIKLEEKTLFGYQCNRFYRSNIIKENGIHFESVILYEDYFFNLR